MGELGGGITGGKMAAAYESVNNLAAEFTLVTCDPCTIPDIIGVIMRFGNFLLFYVIVPLAALSIAIAGLYYMSAVTTPANKEKAKGILWDVVKGLVIALSAYVVVKTIFNMLGVSGVTLP